MVNSNRNKSWLPLDDCHSAYTLIVSLLIYKEKIKKCLTRFTRPMYHYSIFWFLDCRVPCAYMMTQRTHTKSQFQYGRIPSLLWYTSFLWYVKSRPPGLRRDKLTIQLFNRGYENTFHVLHYLSTTRNLTPERLTSRKLLSSRWWSLKGKTAGTPLKK